MERRLPSRCLRVIVILLPGSQPGIIDEMRIPLKLLDPDLPVPTHTHAGDAGVDLHARVDATLEPGERIVLPTGVAVALPDGYAGLVLARSGLAAQKGLGVLNAPGLVDSGYRGEIKVILVNHGRDPVRLERGERIAQLVVTPVVLQEFDVVGDLPESERGEGGLGSSGITVERKGGLPA